MSGLYDRIWSRSIHWDEVNYIRPVQTLGFWKLPCSVLDSKNDCCGCGWGFSGMFRNNFQEILLILVYVFSRVNHKATINEGFCRYLNKVQKINSE